MKPCSKNKARIAWLSAHALEPQEADRLRQHFRVCPGCMEHFEELCAISAEHKNLTKAADKIEATDFFHSQLVQRIARIEMEPAQTKVFLNLRGWMIWPLGLAAVTLAALFGWSLSHSDRMPSPRVMAQVVKMPSPANITPNLAAYQSAISKSPDQLDLLLNAQIVPSQSRQPDTATVRAFQRDLPD